MVIVVDSNGNLSISVRPYTILQAKRWNILNQDHGFADLSHQLFRQEASQALQSFLHLLVDAGTQ